MKGETAAERNKACAERNRAIRAARASMAGRPVGRPGRPPRKETPGRKLTPREKIEARRERDRVYQREYRRGLRRRKSAPVNLCPRCAYNLDRVEKLENFIEKMKWEKYIEGMK